MNIVYNEDCMIGMKRYPDNYFDLAVVDPPYGDAQNEGVGATGSGSVVCSMRTVERTGGAWAKKYGKKIIAWDVAPGKEYFRELFRVSRNQIIWGGNYFELPATRCFLVWDKTNIHENFSMAQAELAWTSYTQQNAKIFRYPSNLQPDRFHPTQKPINLYRWIFGRYAKPGYKILDTHLGSGSSRIAAYDAGLDFVGFEIDAEYFRLAEERYQFYTSQIRMIEGNADAEMLTMTEE